MAVLFLFDSPKVCQRSRFLRGLHHRRTKKSAFVRGPQVFCEPAHAEVHPLSSLAEYLRTLVYPKSGFLAKVPRSVRY